MTLSEITNSLKVPAYATRYGEDKPTIVLVNEAYRRFTGSTDEDLINHSPTLADHSHAKSFGISADDGQRYIITLLYSQRFPIKDAVLGVARGFTSLIK